MAVPISAEYGPVFVRAHLQSAAVQIGQNTEVASNEMLHCFFRINVPTQPVHFVNLVSCMITHMCVSATVPKQGGGNGPCSASLNWNLGFGLAQSNIIWLNLCFHTFTAKAVRRLSLCQFVVALALRQIEMHLLVVTHSSKKFKDILLLVVPTGRAVSAK